MVTGCTREQYIWAKKFAELAQVLRPYVVEIDGDTYIGEDAPPAVVEIYSEMMTVGYAKGWM